MPHIAVYSAVGFPLHRPCGYDERDFCLPDAWLNRVAGPHLEPGSGVDLTGRSSREAWLVLCGPVSDPALSAVRDSPPVSEGVGFVHLPVDRTRGLRGRLGDGSGTRHVRLAATDGPVAGILSLA